MDKPNLSPVLHKSTRSRIRAWWFATLAGYKVVEIKRHPGLGLFGNVNYAVEGAWGIGGKAYSNADLGSAVAAA